MEITKLVKEVFTVSLTLIIIV
jgi:hydroxymethylglutaryl-CoA lyase